VTTSTITDRRDREARAKAERREQLLDAAIEVVRESGPGVSMDQIAAACGVTKPIVYRHFGDRDGLVMAMALRFVAALVGALTPQLARRDDARRLLTSTIDAYLELIERDTNLYRFVSANEPGKRDLVAGLVAEQVSTVLEQYLEAAGLDTSAAEPWGYGLVGMVHFTGDWWARTKAPDRAVIVEQLTTLLWSGFDGIGLGTNDSSPPKRPRSTHGTRPRRRG
jgi:AcrR family transcriptional regulator